MLDHVDFMSGLALKTNSERGYTLTGSKKGGQGQYGGVEGRIDGKLGEWTNQLASGSKWRNMGTNKPMGEFGRGVELFSTSLESALTTSTFVDQDKWDGMGVGEVFMDDYIFVHGHYFQPVEPHAGPLRAMRGDTNRLRHAITTYQAVARDFTKMKITTFEKS